MRKEANSWTMDLAPKGPSMVRSILTIFDPVTFICGIEITLEFQVMHGYRIHSTETPCRHQGDQLPKSLMMKKSPRRSQSPKKQCFSAGISHVNYALITGVVCAAHAGVKPRYQAKE